MTGDLVAGDRHVMHAALVDLRQQFAEGDVADWRALARLLEQHDERHDQQADDGPEGEVPEVCVHIAPVMETFARGPIPGNVPFDVI